MYWDTASLSLMTWRWWRMIGLPLEGDICLSSLIAEQRYLSK